VARTDLETNKPVPTPHVSVWDIPTRLFHWSIVCLVLTSWIAADQGYMRVHLWSGSTLLALLLFRLIWGVIGSTTARFSDFVTPPHTVLGYLRALVSANKPHHAGHNPAGGWMVVVFLALLCAQVGTGLFANDGLHFNGPLALHVGTDTSDRLTALHGTLFNVLLLLIYLHVVAVFFYFFVKNENLIAPMVTGKKPRHHVPAERKLHFVGVSIALAVLAVAAAIVWWIVRP
jgi:cytochrome b